LKLDIVLPSKMEQEKILQFLHLQENFAIFTSTRKSIVLLQFKIEYFEEF